MNNLMLPSLQITPIVHEQETYETGTLLEANQLKLIRRQREKGNPAIVK